MNKLEELIGDVNNVGDALDYLAMKTFKPALLVGLGTVYIESPVPALSYKVLDILDALLLPQAALPREVDQGVGVAVLPHQNGAAIPGLLRGDDGRLVSEGKLAGGAILGRAWWGRRACESYIDTLRGRCVLISNSDSPKYHSRLIL